jgi:LmbE family N-acetylglucosaminyl deacetylase
MIAPHQDDELLTLGAAVTNYISHNSGGAVHALLCTDGRSSGVWPALSNGTGCDWHLGSHSYSLSRAKFIAARDREFHDSCRALGVPESQIHYLPSRQIDTRVTVSHMRRHIRRFLRAYRNQRIVVLAVAPSRASSQHKDHRALGTALLKLREAGWIHDLRLYAEPYDSEVQEKHTREVAAAPQNDAERDRIRAAARSYQRWDPEQGRYAIGYHSVKDAFAILFANEKK